MDTAKYRKLAAAVILLTAVLLTNIAGAEVVSPGDWSQAAREIQELLVQLERLDTEATGFYGPKTEAAVRQFQADSNLDVDGLAGPATRSALEQAVAEDEPSEAQPSNAEVGEAIEVVNHGLLREGDRGEGVEALQEILQELGLSAGTSGIFGPKTTAAVREAQEMADVAVDGMVGDSTWQALAKLKADGVPAAAEKPDVPEPAAETDEPKQAESKEAAPSEQPTPAQYGLLREGDRGEGVEALQEMLQELGLSAGTSGIFGPKTVAAVREAQEMADVAVDGMVGDSTWQALAKLKADGVPASAEKPDVPEPAAEVDETKQAEAKEAAPSEQPTAAQYGLLREGDRGEGVEVLQDALREANLEAGNSGIFGPRTKEAVQQAQRLAGITVDGVVGEATWEALEGLQASHNAMEELPALEGVLREGSRGESVKALQARLVDLDFLNSSVDGVFGSDTRQSVQRFQQAAGISTDGIVGPETWQALEEALPGQYEPVVVEDLHWSEVDRMFPVGAVVTLEDVETGLTFRAKRLYGSNHADIEPLTREDTQILRRIYGGSWSWERRAVIVKIGDRLLAGSINGYPHGGYNIRNNGFPGHICLHFRGSRLHAAARQDPRHQEMVRQSAESQPSSITTR